MCFLKRMNLYLNRMDLYLNRMPLTAALPGLSTSPTADFPAKQAGAVLGTVAYMSPEQAQ